MAFTALVLSLVVGVALADGGACKSDYDCSYGGLCTAGSCVCDAWTTGPTCSLLNLEKPATTGGGLPDQGLQVPGYFSWGGHSTLDAKTGLYQGFFSFMCKRQTLSKWTTVSSVVRATSKKIEGPYTPQEMVMQPWSHNTMLTYDRQTKQHILFFIGTAKANASLWSPCINITEARALAAASPEATMPAMRVSEDSIDSLLDNGFGAARPPKAGDVTAATSDGGLTGKWTIFDGWLPKPVAGGPNIDFSGTTGNWTSFVGGNPAPFVFENGTTLLYFSAQPGPTGWGMSSTCIAVARADNWKGPYKVVSKLPVTRPESEDPFVFRDARGHFHLLTNVNNGHKRCPQGVACGGHAWSADGLQFSDLEIGAYGPRIPLLNGSAWQNAYIERPQVVQDEAGNPIAFFTGMGRTSYVDSCSWVQRFCTKKGSSSCAPTGRSCDYKSTGENGFANFRCPCRPGCREVTHGSCTCK